MKTSATGQGMAPPSGPDKTAMGAAYAVTAFVLWGLLPVYWKALLAVPPVEIFCHRVVWSLLFTALIITLQKRWGEIRAITVCPKILGMLLISCTLVCGNWLLYIWAVNTGHVLETSLGYYINPLVNALLGVIFLKDRLPRLQIAAIGLAFLGVLNLLWGYGHMPWVALGLAFSFAFYGLVRKVVPAAPLPGLFFETLYAGIPSIFILSYWQFNGSAALGHLGAQTDLLLIGAGVVTTAPLLAFAGAAKKMSLTTLGFFQYLSPSLAFLLGVFVYHETFTSTHLVTFLLIWTGIALYSIASLKAHRAVSKAAHATTARS
ncbi:MAG: EamA family transporter RarD [Desulfovibrio sp.]|uniref:EamA family transporter RarD n=1 Tax=Desulfovibrio sp. 7SRBS1 TaxID=3378064 RepID=UPI003B3C2A21